MSSDGYEPMEKAEVIGHFEVTSDKLGQLAALFRAIKQQARVNPFDLDHDEILRLASLGADVATEFEDNTDMWRNQMEKGGIKV